MIATGESHSVREFCELAFKLGGRPITWRGSGIEEIGLDATGKTLREDRSAVFSSGGSRRDEGRRELRAREAGLEAEGCVSGARAADGRGGCGPCGRRLSSLDAAGLQASRASTSRRCLDSSAFEQIARAQCQAGKRAGDAVGDRMGIKTRFLRFLMAGALESCHTWPLR